MRPGAPVTLTSIVKVFPAITSVSKSAFDFRVLFHIPRIAGLPAAEACAAGTTGKLGTYPIPDRSMMMDKRIRITEDGYLDAIVPSPDVRCRSGIA